MPNPTKTLSSLPSFKPTNQPRLRKQIPSSHISSQLLLRNRIRIRCLFAVTWVVNRLYEEEFSSEVGGCERKDVGRVELRLRKGGFAKGREGEDV